MTNVYAVREIHKCVVVRQPARRSKIVFVGQWVSENEDADTVKALSLHNDASLDGEKVCMIKIL